jgi:hypothetical protein
MKRLINWKMFFVLLITCVLTAVLVIPYSLALTSTEVEITPVMMILTIAQNLVLFAVVIFVGLLLSKQIGMGLPILKNVLEGKNQIKELKSILIPSIGLGLAAGVLMVLLAILFNIPELNNSELSISPWKALLASFYGGIGEEVLLRLFLVSLFVWITFKIKKNKDGMPTNFGIWLSIILAAIVFGIGHLPATAQIVPLTGIIILRAIVLNGVGGIIFGWLYWKRGLESAMIAHFSADIVLHIITPFIMVLFSQ